MTEMKFKCPHCRRPLKAPLDFAGQMVTCPSCSHEALVPVTSREAAAAAGYLAVQALVPHRQCLDCRTEVADDSRVCPRCGAVLSERVELPSTTRVEEPPLTTKPRVDRSKEMWIGLGILLILAALGYGWSLLIENQVYCDIVSRAERVPVVEDRLRLLNTYQEQYPRGRYRDAIREHLARAAEFATIQVECQDVDAEGRRVPVPAWLQLLQVKDDDLKAVFEDLKPLTELAKSYNEKKPGQGDLVYCIAFGKVIAAKLSGKVKIVARAERVAGQALFPDVKPGRYLIYGTGVHGTTFVAWFNELQAEAGKSAILRDRRCSIPDRQVLHQNWQPLLPEPPPVPPVEPKAEPPVETATDTPTSTAPAEPSADSQNAAPTPPAEPTGSGG